MMAVHSLKTIQTIPVSMEQAWDFFSSPVNLVAITPERLDFRIISLHHGEHMYPGQIIEYTVRPLWGIAWYWMTEITHVEQGRYFVDEQRYGPYILWHHQHHFREVPGGVEMTDIVHYKVPGWWVGDVLNAVLIRKELQELFRYRYEKVVERFGGWEGQECVVRFK
ncbi:MAG: SRPBCC family protein [Candidatus Pseudobacter hemicellulosilyticus]|uniref:SRPBCC family protein n=1 Tax=Candidatus Pseudobacter hemicellulosilyticus TaxID=3121375 RepID=A0AAJ5WTN3_9BACT|nr:MAG: SRPBCC family protein [Pseudobacter sp.]